MPLFPTLHDKIFGPRHTEKKNNLRARLVRLGVPEDVVKKMDDRMVPYMVANVQQRKGVHRTEYIAALKQRFRRRNRRMPGAPY